MLNKLRKTFIEKASIVYHNNKFSPAGDKLTLMFGPANGEDTFIIIEDNFAKTVGVGTTFSVALLDYPFQQLVMSADKKSCTEALSYYFDEWIAPFFLLEKDYEQAVFDFCEFTEHMNTFRVRKHRDLVRWFDTTIFESSLIFDSIVYSKNNGLVNAAFHLFVKACCAIVNSSSKEMGQDVCEVSSYMERRNHASRGGQVCVRTLSKKSKASYNLLRTFFLWFFDAIHATVEEKIDNSTCELNFNLKGDFNGRSFIPLNLDPKRLP